MTDYFALLDESRRPWLDPDQLKAKFLGLSAQAHPDRISTATAPEKEAANRRFAELNAAFNCLREPKRRLRHLLDLELGGTPNPVQAIPQGLMQLFTEIADLRRQVDAFLAEAGGVQSPLLRVPLLERAQEWMNRLQAVQRRLRDNQEELLQELQTLDTEWVRLGEDPVHRGVMIQRLEQIHQRLSFSTRWSGQLQESMVQLSF